VVLVPPARGRSVLYASLSNELLYQRLRKHNHFCRDTQLGGALHPRGASFREVNRTPSLHISLEPHDRLAVHLDRSGPAVGRSPKGGCNYERSRAARHIWDDILPSLAWTWQSTERPGRRRESPSFGRPAPLLLAGPFLLPTSLIDGATPPDSRFARCLHFPGPEGGADSRSGRTPSARPPPAPPGVEGSEGGDVYRRPNP
jgi:hypothetical protein